MISVVAFEPKHLDGLVFASEPELQAFREVAAHLDGIGFTAIGDDGVIACVGIRPIWGGVGEAWAVFSPQAKPYMFPLSRKVKRGLEPLMNDMGLIRLQTVVRCGNEKAISWARWLGFEVEGYMRKYFRRTDYLLMARVRG